MKPLALQSTTHIDFTCVSNYFLDTYMPKASGEFVKIYLYILRCLNGNAVTGNCNSYRSGCTYYNNQSDCFCVSFLADKFCLTENDIMRALKYWENEGLLALSYNDSTELSGITVVSDYRPAVNAEVQPDTQSLSQPVVPNEPVKTASLQKPSYSSSELKKFTDNEELAQLLYIAQKYIGKTLSVSETNSVIFFYDTLKMSADLIEFLLEYCISKGHKSMRYIEKVAINWSEEGIVTLAQAKESVCDHSDNAYSVLKAFGINGRGVAPVERDFISKWSDSYCFDSDVIIEACNRTIQAIHQPSFDYADSILSRWKERGIKCLADIRVLDDEFDRTRKATAGSSTRLTVSSSGQKKSSGNRFNNFSQRDYNYDELEKNIVSKTLV